MRRLALALLSALWLAPAWAEAKPLVILLSWDGVRHDYPDRAAFPGLARLEREGVRAERLVSVFPSSTFPAHVSLATGTYPDRHGIVDNVFFDRARDASFDFEAEADWIEAEPLWAAAERQGVAAATFFWVGSETPWRGVAARDRRAPFDADVGEAEKVRQIVEWIDRPEAERPGLVMSWWHGADLAGHRRGPDHPAVAEALAEQDAQLQSLLAALDARGLWPETTLLLVSDHGMTAVRESLDVEGALEAAGVDARVMLGSSVAHVFLADPAARAKARAALAALDGVEVHDGEALPEARRLRFPARTGDLVLFTAPPRTFRRASFVQSIWIGLGALFGGEMGLHGYDPELPDMGGVFYALGRGVPAGATLGAVRAIDVAPTVARLLAIDPPRDAEGAALPGFTP